MNKKSFLKHRTFLHIVGDIAGLVFVITSVTAAFPRTYGFFSWFWGIGSILEHGGQALIASAVLIVLFRMIAAVMHFADHQYQPAQKQRPVTEEGFVRHRTFLHVVTDLFGIVLIIAGVTAAFPEAYGFFSWFWGIGSILEKGSQALVASAVSVVSLRIIAIVLHIADKRYGGTTKENHQYDEEYDDEEVEEE